MIDMSKIDELCCMTTDLCSSLKTELNKGIAVVKSNDVQNAADVIKDLATAMEKIAECKYYMTVTEAMEDGDEARYGYNNRRYSNGHYAPKGKGSMSGYRPYLDQEPYIDAYLHDPMSFEENMRMGYGHQMTGDGYSRNGSAYDNYRSAKRHYTETRSATDKEAMNKHANEHIDNAVDSLKDIWMDADPAMRSKLKTSVADLLSDMK